MGVITRNPQPPMLGGKILTKGPDAAPSADTSCRRASRRRLRTTCRCVAEHRSRATRRVSVGRSSRAGESPAR